MLYLLVAVSVAVADQLLKYWVVKNIPLHGIRTLIPRVIHLTHVRNEGMAFSMMEGARWIFVGVTFLLCVIMVVFLFRTSLKKPGKIAIAAVLGGAVGNGIDRIVHGYVIDMLEAEFVEFAVCNFADCVIVVGAIVFFFCYLVHVRKEEKTEREKQVKTAKAVSAGSEEITLNGEEKEAAILEESNSEHRMPEGNESD